MWGEIKATTPAQLESALNFAWLVIEVWIPSSDKYNQFLMSKATVRAGKPIVEAKDCSTA
jgi:hypothetical protein